MPSCNASSNCHIEWRPSRWLACALAGLGVMAALSLGLSALPPVLAWPGALGVAAWGLLLARRVQRQAPCAIDWRGGDEPAYLTRHDGITRLVAVQVHLRGPLATLSGTHASGRIQRLAWWPDTLHAGDRRQLRLAASVSWRSEKPLREQAA